MAERLTLHEVADLLGVHYMTAYRYVRTGVLPATKDGSEWRVSSDDVERFRAGDDPAMASARPGRRKAGSAPSRRHWVTRLESRLLAGDAAGAWSVVEAALSSGTDLTDIELDVVAPAMIAIGERWRSGDVDVAEEHRASVIAARLLARLSARFARPGRTRGSVVLGSVAGDHHGLPVSILADVVGSAGFDVVDLGADVPVDSFAFAVRAVPRLRAVGVSVTVPGFDDAVRATLDAVRAEVDPDVLLLAGGRAVGDEEAARRLGADAWAPDARALVALLDPGAASRDAAV